MKKRRVAFSAALSFYARFWIPDFDGALFSKAWRDALWDKFRMAAPRRQRQSVEQYKIAKIARRRSLSRLAQMVGHRGEQVWQRFVCSAGQAQAAAGGRGADEVIAVDMVGGHRPPERLHG
jgi:DNA-binding PucR family transcriptional regulator